MPDTETEALLAIHVMAHAIPGSESCECRMTAEQDFTCGYCRFVAAGIYDHLIDSGYRIVRTALIDGFAGHSEAETTNND